MSTQPIQEASEVLDQETECQFSLRSLEPAEATSAWWTLLKTCILGSLPATVPASEEFLANILSSLGDGRLTAMIFRQGRKPLAVLTVVVMKDTIARVNILRLYTLYGVSKLPSGAWPALLTELRKYAVERECSTIMAETVNAKVVEVVAWLGGDASTRLILLPVKES